MGITSVQIINYKCDICNNKTEKGEVITTGQVINLLNLPYHDSDRAFNLDISVHIENVVGYKPCMCKKCFNSALSKYLITQTPQTNQQTNS